MSNTADMGKRYYRTMLFELSTKALSLTHGIYRHYKGNSYQVLGVGRHSETHEEHVFYQAMYGSYGLWVRPLDMFMEEVEWEGKTVPRFTFVGPNR